MIVSTDINNKPFDKRHRHKRSFALSGDNNFDFLPTNNRKNSNSSLPEFINTNNATSSSNPVIDFDNAEKFIQQSTTKAKKESYLRHKRSESAPTEMLTFSPIEDEMNGNWLDLSKTSSDDQIKKYWESNYSNIVQDMGNEPLNNDNLLMDVDEEDENNSGSNSSSPVKTKMSYGIPEQTSMPSMNNLKGTRQVSDTSYRSITPSSATTNLSASSFRITLSTPATAMTSSSPLATASSTTHNTNVNRNLGRTKHTSNFHQRYHNFGIPYSPSASSAAGNGTGSSQGSSRVSSATSGDSGTSADKREYGNLKTPEGNSGLSPLASEVISKYATMGKKKSNGKMGVKTRGSGSNLNTPFNFRSQEYDISKDLEDLNILDNENDPLMKYLAEENSKKQASISTITNTTYSSGTILDPNFATNERNLFISDDEFKRTKKHSRQLTDTESNITLIVPGKDTKSPGEFEKNLQVFEEEPVAINNHHECSQDDLKSYVSDKRGSKENIRKRISNSMSFSNLSLRTNDEGGRKIKKSLSIQSLSKYLRPNADNTSEDNHKKDKRKRDSSKRHSLIAWIFKSK
ncbi:uncharacterized protein HGUI_01787 [Hanseniaspora guilliermondii]|uniref:Uncharacterized protein n=1 Tax=Hanseniaspora guilliermondii TaxID=56406 RepID=A0A1L0B3P8_9ASCO|nr:uncharacterized protein HGUI_01787 [Hanseniaspora guilliermondii]